VIGLFVIVAGLRLRAYFRDPQAFEDYILQAGKRCGNAPFLLPTDGYVGFFWGDSFRPGHRHQGIDIFGPPGPETLGKVPVVASFDGYLTRLPEWRSAVILRVPQDPLRPGRQIWLLHHRGLSARDGGGLCGGGYAARISRQLFGGS